MASRTIRHAKGEFELSYEQLNPGAAKCILWLHGWGSNKELMKQAFGRTLPGWRHLYLDMPGFGRSPNDRFLTTGEYAEIVRLFLDDLGVEPAVIAGHSFGGKVATLLNPPCLVLLSSSGVPVPKPFSVRAKIALFKLLKPLGLGKLRSIFASQDVQGMNPGMYETFKRVVNEAFEENFAKVSGRALLFWGESDTATPLWTGERIAGLIPDAAFVPMKGDHYFFLDAANAAEIGRRIEESCV
jgi:pimeloyl-ACP methyl ester carboxylesterase